MYTIPLVEAFNLVELIEHDIFSNIGYSDDLKKAGGDPALIIRLQNDNIDMLAAARFIIRNVKESASSVMLDLDGIDKHLKCRMYELGIDEETLKSFSESHYDEYD